MLSRFRASILMCVPPNRPLRTIGGASPSTQKDCDTTLRLLVFAPKSSSGPTTSRSTRTTYLTLPNTCLIWQDYLLQFRLSYISNNRCSQHNPCSIAVTMITLTSQEHLPNRPSYLVVRLA